jgi:hypothetical protein
VYFVWDNSVWGCCYWILRTLFGHCWRMHLRWFCWILPNRDHRMFSFPNISHICYRLTILQNRDVGVIYLLSFCLPFLQVQVDLKFLSSNCSFPSISMVSQLTWSTSQHGMLNSTHSLKVPFYLCGVTLPGYSTVRALLVANIECAASNQNVPMVFIHTATNIYQHNAAYSWPYLERYVLFSGYRVISW